MYVDFLRYLYSVYISHEIPIESREITHKIPPFNPIKNPLKSPLKSPWKNHHHHEITMKSPWNHHEITMKSPWNHHEITMKSPWNHHETLLWRPTPCELCEAPGLQTRPRSDGSAPLPEPEKSIGNIWKSSLFTNEIQVIFFNGMILWTPEWINRRIYRWKYRLFPFINHSYNHRWFSRLDLKSDKPLGRNRSPGCHVEKKHLKDS